MFRALAWLLLLGLFVPVAQAEDKVPVPGSSIEFPDQVEPVVARQIPSMKLTGTALRSKARFRLYAIASYCDKPRDVESPEHLAEIDRPKQLHLIMERRLPTRLVTGAIQSAIEANYPDQFQEQINRVLEYLSRHTLSAGTNVRFTHLAGRGVTFRVEDAEELVVEDLKFSRAVWDVYFGKQNLGEAIKQGLVSRIPTPTAE